MGRPAKELIVSAGQRAQLESIARSQSLPAALVQRAQMILRMAEGEPNNVLAEHFGLSRPTVTFWRTRFRERGYRERTDMVKAFEVLGDVPFRHGR